MIPTGVPGLDTVLGGGFFHPSIMILGGTAGSGKTICATQILFAAAAAGEQCVYVSGISEPLMSVRNYMSSFSFFSEDLFQEGQMTFVDLEQYILEGPEKVLEKIGW